jgi:hypothetical protein
LNGIVSPTHSSGTVLYEKGAKPLVWFHIRHQLGRI